MSDPYELKSLRFSSEDPRSPIDTLDDVADYRSYSSDGEEKRDDCCSSSSSCEPSFSLASKMKAKNAIINATHDSSTAELSYTILNAILYECEVILKAEFILLFVGILFTWLRRATFTTAIMLPGRIGTIFHTDDWVATISSLSSWTYVLILCKTLFVYLYLVRWSRAPPWIQVALPRISLAIVVWCSILFLVLAVDGKFIMSDVITIPVSLIVCGFEIALYHCIRRIRKEYLQYCALSRKMQQSAHATAMESESLQNETCAHNGKSASERMMQYFVN